MPVLYLTEQGSTLRKEGGLFLVTKEDRELQKVQAVKVEQVVVLGNINLTTPVINYLLQEGIDCVFCNSYGKYHGRLLSNESKYGLLRQSQMETVGDVQKKLAIAREVVRGKFLNQRTLLMRYRRENDPSTSSGHRLPVLEDAIEAFEGGLNKLEKVADIGTLLGIEGNASARYFAAFKDLLKKGMGFTARVRRPPTDPINSMLSFGYTLLAYNMQSAVSIVGLDPFLGCLHAIEYSRPSLVLDLMEEFRCIIVDSVVLRVVNNNILTDADFERPEKEGMMISLSQEAIKKFVHHYEERVQTVIQNPVTGHRVHYRRCFELQARQMARVFLKQDPSYKPFLVK